MTDTPRSRSRLHQFAHPSGRTVHVATNPEVAQTLRRQLTETHGEDGFDLYMKGSDEHVSSLPSMHPLQLMRLKAYIGQSTT